MTAKNLKFWYNFTGRTLDTNVWLENDETGTGIFAMIDGVDEGYSIEAGANANDVSSISHNGIQHWDEDTAVMIAVIRRTSATMASQVGFSSTTVLTGSAQYSIMTNDTNNTNYEINSDDGTTNSTSASSFAIDTVFHNIQLKFGLTTQELLIDGATQVTKTNHMPTIGQNPIMRCFSRSAGTGRETRIKYMECYNL